MTEALEMSYSRIGHFRFLIHLIKHRSPALVFSNFCGGLMS